MRGGKRDAEQHETDHGAGCRRNEDTEFRDVEKRNAENEAGAELFWGLDQLRYLELYLDGQDPLESATFDQSGFRGP